MDLHSLHRPTNTQNSRQQSSSKTTDHGISEQEDACLWKRELAKMETIANQALEKLERKRADKRALQAELVTWRTRYNDLAQAQMQALATRQKDQIELTQLLNERQAEHDEIKERLLIGAKAVRDLKAMEAQVQALRSQTLPDVEVRKKLQAETDVVRKKLQAETDVVCKKLQAENEGVRKKLQAENEGVRKKLQAAEAEVAGMRKKLQNAQDELAASRDKLRAVQLEVAPTREKLRAAVKESSQKTDKLVACVSMLARGEQVLDTCSNLYANNSGSRDLAAALATTRKNFAEFRLSLDCAKQAF